MSALQISIIFSNCVGFQIRPVDKKPCRLYRFQLYWHPCRIADKFYQDTTLFEWPIFLLNQVRIPLHSWYFKKRLNSSENRESDDFRERLLRLAAGLKPKLEPSENSPWKKAFEAVFLIPRTQLRAELKNSMEAPWNRPNLYFCMKHLVFSKNPSSK